MSETFDKKVRPANAMEIVLGRFRAYWRAWWHLCPTCNSDAPEIDTCQSCMSWRGEFPPPDWLVSVWLQRHFEPKDWSEDAIVKRSKFAGV